VLLEENMENTQKASFQIIRNFLAGRALGATRDQSLLEEVMKCLFAHKRMLLNGGIPSGSDEFELAKRYRKYLADAGDVFVAKDELLLDPASIKFIHDHLSRIDLLSADRDPVGDLYETFIGSSIRGSEGQFFTPQNAGRWLVEAVAPASGERIIDPACGAGGFLLWAAQFAKSRLDLYGIEKDSYLAELARARTAILGIKAQVYCANSLSFESASKDFRIDDFREAFDVVLTNPPFGKNITSVSAQVQSKFALGQRWRRLPTGHYVHENELTNKAPPQVLFIERVISLLRPGGRAGIVVPESLLSSRSYGHVVQYLQEHSAIRAVVGMPESLFKHSGKGGTHTKTCLLMFEKGRKSSSVFMAEAKWCGHDSRGKSIPNDDLPQIARDFRAFRSSKRKEMMLGYRVENEQLATNILAPRYHEPTAQRSTNQLIKTHDLVTVKDLLDRKVIEIRTGDEVGKLAYGTGSVPFVRTSDISGWEIKIDPKHSISQEIFDQLKSSQDVRREDILMVRDGTYLIGSCAIVTEYDERIVYQSHILKVRCLDQRIMPPHLLLAIFSSDPVQQQIKSKTFTQDIIDSLGNRLLEIVLPIPKSKKVRQKIETIVKKVIADRVEARELSRRAKCMVVDPKFT
jgi:type I restriction enzyme M protein